MSQKWFIDRGSESILEQYTFKNINAIDGNLLQGKGDQGSSLDAKQVTPQCTPRESPSGRVTPRKPLRPLKSATKSDPSIKGVIFTVRSGIKRSVSLEEFTPDVFIDSIFSSCSSSKKRPKSQPCSDSKIPIRRNGRRRKCKTPVRLFSSRCSSRSSPSEPFCSEDSGDSLSLSPSCDDFLGVVPINVEKECASCGTNKTPLWRDAEDGTHLCNACGIRWKKYRVRCIRCWYIPKKEEKVTKTCPSCSTHGSIKMALPKAVKRSWRGVFYCYVAGGRRHTTSKRQRRNFQKLCLQKHKDK